VGGSFRKNTTRGDRRGGAKHLALLMKGSRAGQEGVFFKESQARKKENSPTCVKVRGTNPKTSMKEGGEKRRKGTAAGGVKYG